MHSREYMTLEICSILVRFSIKQQNFLTIITSIFRCNKEKIMKIQFEAISKE